MRNRTALTLAAPAALALALTGCSGDAAGGISTATSASEETGSTGPSAGSTPGAADVSASDVIAAFTAARLPVREPRDNTDGWCPNLGCTDFWTTEDVTVLTFGDASTAQSVADAYYGDNGYVSGTVVLSFLAQRTPDAQRPAYAAVVDQLTA